MNRNRLDALLRDARWARMAAGIAGWNAQCKRFTIGMRHTVRALKALGRTATEAQRVNMEQLLKSVRAIRYGPVPSIRRIRRRYE